MTTPNAQSLEGLIKINDAQLRKERLEADIICRCIGKARYSVVLDHVSEQAIWTFWRSLRNGRYGRWYGTNDMDDRVIDAPTLACAKQDLRLCNFPPSHSHAGPEE